MQLWGQLWDFWEWGWGVDGFEKFGMKKARDLRPELLGDPTDGSEVSASKNASGKLRVLFFHFVGHDFLPFLVKLF